MLGFSFHHSDCIDFFEMKSFIYKYSYGTPPLFQFLRAFHSNVWYLIFASILILALVSSLCKFKLINIFDYIWNFFTLLFSKTIQKHHKEIKVKTNSWYLAVVWLLPCNWIHFVSLGSYGKGASNYQYR